MNSDRDIELLRRFQRGDISAFEQFIEIHQGRLHRLACAFLYQESQAEDAVQEVLIRAYKGLPTFRFASKPFSWLYRTLKNVCHEMNRKHGREICDRLVEEYEYHESRDFENQQNLKHLYAALSELSRRERDVVLLRVFEEFSEKEAAMTLGVRQGTVKTLLHRGLKKLQSKCGDIIET